MKYVGMPSAMWLLFGGSFQKNLTAVLGYDKAEAKGLTQKAKVRYKRVIGALPDFEKGDRFLLNIVSCAQFAAFYLVLPHKPSLDETTAYYDRSMMTKPTKWFCRLSGKKKFTDKNIEAMKKTERFRAADRNPYSWNMELEQFEDGSGYCAKFTSCGICRLLQDLGIAEATPAMCALDFAMSEAGGKSEFTREHTIASGWTYCDCNYRKKESK